MAEPENKTNENTTPEITVEALQKKIAELEGLLDKQKKATSAASSDAANWKKQVRDAQDEATRKEAEREEQWAAMEKSLAEYKKREAKAESKSAMLAMGYPEELAEKRAEFLSNDDAKSAMGVEREFIEWYGKQLKADQQRSMGNPASGSKNDSAVTREQFSKMSLAERAKLKAEHPNVYAEFTK